MWRDPIVDEVRKVRDEYAKQLNYDLKAICRDIKEQETKSGKTTVTLPARYTKSLKV